MSRSRSKIKKETITVSVNIKPQNIAAMALTNFSGGSHEKSNKAKRLKAKMEFKKEVHNLL